MKNWLTVALVVALASATLSLPAEAGRLGGGKSTGMQRNMPARTAPDAVPAKPATPAPAANPATPATAAAAAATPAKRSWMGPLAGLAAGLGLAALFSHFGMGEGLANVVMIALLAAGAFLLVRFLLARFGGGARAATPALAGAAAGTPAANPWAAPVQRSGIDERPAAFRPADVPSSSASTAATAASTAPAVAAAFVPASFDSEGFAHTAKLIFIRLQAANDAADLNDLRRFTTPEMFAAVRLDLQDRGPAKQQTDVLKVDAQVLDVAQESDQQIVSVRFRGQLTENVGAAPIDFDEIWHLVKPVGDAESGWAIAGIEQGLLKA